MKAVGIDLGTTNSLVAVVQDGQARVLADAEGRCLLPSAVRYDDGGHVVVGWPARERASQHPLNTLLSVKRLMGRTKEEAESLGLHDYVFVQDGAVLRIDAGGHVTTPVETSAEILKVLKERAEIALGGPVERAVITVPAYFDDTQRQATRQAGRMAGLEVMRLLNEPTAAALAYGLDKQKEGRFAIFDLGGGTFDISILHLVDGVFEVLSTGGDTQLGGDDFDRVVAEDLLLRAGVQPHEASPAMRRSALDVAEKAKVILTDHFEAVAQLNMDDGRTYERTLCRDDYEGLVRPILERVVPPCKRALEDAGVHAEQLDGIVLVGGSTRSPFIQRYVAELFGLQPLGDIDPDQVVALGAASQADLLSIDSELRLVEGGDVLLLDVTPLSVGLETMGGLAEKVIPRCSQIPASRTQEFTTYQNGQTAMDIHVVQGERELVEDCRSLARFQLTGIPAGAAGQARVRVTFQVDADGILKVSAMDVATGTQQTVEVVPAHGLSDSQVEEMLQASLDFAEEDVNARFLRTAQIEGRRALNALGSAITTDGALLEGDERTTIEAAISDLENVLEGTDHRVIQDLTELLDQLSGGFAQRRMNHALNAGLKNVDIDVLEKELAEPTTDSEN